MLRTAQGIEGMGAKHLACPVEEFRIDEKNRIITSPAYMLAGSVSEAYAGISDCVRDVLALI